MVTTSAQAVASARHFDLVPELAPLAPRLKSPIAVSSTPEVQRGANSMKWTIAICIALLVLPGCANTAYGLKQDGVQTSHALDDATQRMLSAGAKT